MPQEAAPGEVILSKRNELGILSNFAHTPFSFKGRRYKSLEGFWQMMKYPEGPEDPRAAVPGVIWPHTRNAVSQMIGFEAKRAGSFGSDVMKKMGINWVTFRGGRLEYRTSKKGDHYKLIVEATWAKLGQNRKVREILLKTGDLILRPDHHQSPDASPAWRYHLIYMEIRSHLRASINKPKNSGADGACVTDQGSVPDLANLVPKCLSPQH